MKKNLSIVNIEKQYSNLETLVQITPKLRNAMSVDYAITITLKPLIYSKPYEEQLEITSINIVNLFNDCKLTLIAELTKTYNIHYHGIISIPLTLGGDPKKIFFDRLRRYSKVGKSECEQMVNYDTWSTYIQKDIHIHIKNNIIYPILKDDYEIYNTCTETL